MNSDSQIFLSDLIDLGIIPCVAISFALLALMFFSIRHLFSDDYDVKNLTKLQLDLDVTMIFIASPTLITFSAIFLLAALINLVASLIFSQPIHWY